MWLAEEFAVRPLNVIVQVRTFVVGFKVPVHVPVAGEFTPAELPFWSTSFDAFRFAMYVMFCGPVALSLPHAIATPRLIAIASFNTCFCIGSSPVSGGPMEVQVGSSGNRPRCCSGYSHLSGLPSDGSCTHHGCHVLRPFPLCAGGRGAAHVPHRRRAGDYRQSRR